jgi:hypothetical protein
MIFIVHPDCRIEQYLSEVGGSHLADAVPYISVVLTFEDAMAADLAGRRTAG